MRRQLWVLGLGVAVATAGCRATRPDASATALPGPVLAEAARSLPAPDLSVLPAVLPPSIATPEAARYLRLSADECRRAACTHAALARGILAAADGNAAPNRFSPRQVAVDGLRRTVANDLAREARNRTAGGALELYYRLQEAELLADVLDRSLAEIDALVRAADLLAAGGFSEAPEAFTLRKAQLDLRAEQLTLRAGIRRLNTELKPLLGLADADANLLPADGVQVATDALDARAAVARAVAGRGDLQAIRALQTGLDKQTVDAVRQAIAGLLPPLGAITAAANTLAPGLQKLLPFLEKTDVGRVRRQLQLFQEDREREVAKEVTAAVDDYHSQRDRLTVSRRRVAVEAARVAGLTVKRDNGLPVETELRKARLDALAAEREQLKDAYAWKRADVTIRKLLGVLCDGDGDCGCP